jgi:hypothetical protein
VQVVALDLVDPAQQGVKVIGDAEVTAGKAVCTAAGQREDQAGGVLRVGAPAGGELVADPAVDTALWRLPVGPAAQRSPAEARSTCSSPRGRSCTAVT